MVKEPLFPFPTPLVAHFISNIEILNKFCIKRGLPCQIHFKRKHFYYERTDSFSKKSLLN